MSLVPSGFGIPSALFAAKVKRLVALLREGKIRHAPPPFVDVVRVGSQNRGHPKWLLPFCLPSISNQKVVRHFEKPSVVFCGIQPLNLFCSVVLDSRMVPSYLLCLGLGPSGTL